MTALDPWYTARAAMRGALVADLQGTEADEHLREPPLDRYIVGILHPPTQGPIEDSADVPESETGTQADAEYDPGVSLSRMRYPSSVGLTFGVDVAQTASVLVQVSADRYVIEVSADGTFPDNLGKGPNVDITGDADGRQRRTRSKEGQRWNRVALGPLERLVDVRTPGAQRVDLDEGLSMRIVVRPATAEVVNVTVALVNEFRRPVTGKVDHLCWFRPSIHVATVDGAFNERSQRAVSTSSDPDARSNDLLYRDARSVAVGHGCAVTWDEQGPVTQLSTTFFPTQDVRGARASRADVPPLGMASLSRTDDRAVLLALVDAYETWIQQQAERTDSLEAYQRPAAQEHLDAARRAAVRMRAGIDVLDHAAHAGRAFRVMNAVMQEQRARQVMIRNESTRQPEAEQQWRPFQMAFVLLNLPGLVDPSSEDREVADLLWFPTGGGKTEAYLGLIAFTLTLRRLRGAPGDGGGVGVIMRYTLRLLTLQQFERAAGLVCALELWRRHELPAAEPVSIGLWVGQAATPNDVKAAAKALRKAEADGQDAEEGNPRQLLRCPWCGSPLSADDYDADRKANRLTITCSRATCEFKNGIPVHVVDSDVYRVRPSLVIGTVDKFALLAWRERAGSLFGTDGTVDPPDLIVQDELHLISGPLGTLVGLYEMTVDAAATGEARPKVVASTATIRRAREQVQAVFARRSEQFPPPGIDPDDSFFAVAAPAEELPTRQYVGVMAPGSSHATLLVRAYAALLQGALDLEAPAEVKDAYWTLLGYFNSLRVLGAAYMQTIDDVPDRLGVLAGRHGTSKRQMVEPRELTSRQKSREIPLELERLSTSYPSERCPDVVLATNMISVGVDIDRLGLMAVMGQPQTTSEYIQATSRVGRQRPGLVVTLFNAARTRDLSHYENFVPYHRALYRQVEATGATPFAARATDRGLHGAVVALARLIVPGAAGDKSVRQAVSADGQTRLTDIVRNRVRIVAPEEEERVMADLGALFEHWEDGLADGVTQYASWQPAEDALIIPAGGGLGGAATEQLAQFPVAEVPWATLTSLRNVDAESSLYIVRRRPSSA